MSATVVPPAEFDIGSYIANRNARVPGAVEEVKEEPKVEAKAEPVVDPPAKVEEQPKLERRDKGNFHARQSRRALRNTLIELGEERVLRQQFESRLAALESNKGGDPSAAEVEVPKTDPEPQREKFATELEFTRALGAWEGRNAAKKEITATQQTERTARERAQYVEDVILADKKEEKDRQIFEDWDEVRKKAEKSGFKFTQTPTLIQLLELSDVRAGVAHYLCSHLEDFQKLESFKDNPSGQIQFFRRLEGKVESYTEGYVKRREQKATEDKQAADKAEEKRKADSEEKAKQPTAEERDAKKATPTAAISPKAGSVVDDTPPMIIGDGVLNPKWSAWKNAQKAQR